jgi:hypothetical protein
MCNTGKMPYRFVLADITREIYGLFGIAGTLAVMYHRSFDNPMFDVLKNELGVANIVSAEHESEASALEVQEESKLLTRLDSLEQNLKTHMAEIVQLTK